MSAIHTINIGGTNYDVKATHYATCSTAPGTAAKAAIIQNGAFALEVGTRVAVKFTNLNSAASPKLNVQGTGAKPIILSGSSALPASQYWKANQVVDFVYDGTYWRVVGAIADNNTTYSAIPNDVIDQICGTTLTYITENSEVTF